VFELTNSLGNCEDNRVGVSSAADAAREAIRLAMAMPVPVTMHVPEPHEMTSGPIAEHGYDSAWFLNNVMPRQDARVSKRRGFGVGVERWRGNLEVEVHDGEYVSNFVAQMIIKTGLRESVVRPLLLKSLISHCSKNEDLSISYIHMNLINSLGSTFNAKYQLMVAVDPNRLDDYYAMTEASIILYMKSVFLGFLIFGSAKDSIKKGKSARRALASQFQTIRETWFGLYFFVTAAGTGSLLIEKFFLEVQRSGYALVYLETISSLNLIALQNYYKTFGFIMGNAIEFSKWLDISDEQAIMYMVLHNSQS